MLDLPHYFSLESQVDMLQYQTIAKLSISMFQNLLITLLKLIKLNVRAFFVLVIILLAGIIYIISAPSLSFLNSVPAKLSSLNIDEMTPIKDATLSIENAAKLNPFKTQNESSEAAKIATTGASTSVSNLDQVIQPSKQVSDSGNYVVAEGDSLWSIAEKQLGSGYKYHELAQINNLNPLDFLAVGSELQIVEEAEVATPISGEVKEKAPISPEISFTNQQSQIITVQPGDSLWSIAEDKLGDGNLWTTIYQENISVVGTNPDLIYTGQQFSLGKSSTK